MVGDSSGSSHDKSGSYGERFTFFPYGVAAVTANYFYTCGDFTQSICKASSREGTMTSACTPAILGEIRDSTGRRNANVFPEPVGESSIMSFGRVAVSSICFCMPFSESIFKLRHALSIRADVSFMSAKIM